MNQENETLHQWYELVIAWILFFINILVLLKLTHSDHFLLE